MFNHQKSISIERMLSALLPYSSEFSSDQSYCCQQLIASATVLSINNNSLKSFVLETCRVSDSLTGIPSYVWELYSEALVQSIYSSGLLEEGARYDH